MNWERCTPTWPPLAAENIPTELLRGLERYTEGARLHKVRLRWRPHGNKAQKGFLTKDRLLNTADRSCEDIAAAVASFAAHLYEQGLCENRFEAQVHRTPESIALIAGAGRMSYAVLEERANRLAHLLLAEGAGAGGEVTSPGSQAINLAISSIGRRPRATSIIDPTRYRTMWCR